MRGSTLEHSVAIWAEGEVLDHLHYDSELESSAEVVHGELQGLSVATLFIEPGGSSENGHFESIDGKLRGQLLSQEIFDL